MSLAVEMGVTVGGTAENITIVVKNMLFFAGQVQTSRD